VKQSRWTSDLHWVRTSQQTRSEKTQAKLLDAAEELLSERGVENTSVVDIAEHAGVSIGAVYHHFSDKKAVIYALFDRINGEYDATTRAATDPARWQGATLGDVLRGYIEVSLGTIQTAKGTGMPAFRISKCDPDLTAQYDKMIMVSDDAVAALLLERRDEIGHPNPELAIKFVLEQLGSMCRVRMLSESVPTRFGDQTDEQFMIEALRSTCGYLQVDLPIDLPSHAS